MTRHVTEEVLRTYTIELIGERESFPFNEPRIPGGLLREAEENINDVLNKHYRVRIREWDAEEETPNA